MPGRQDRSDLGATDDRKPGAASPGLGQVTLFLHAHLPDCRRSDLAASMEETWFFEALAETYLPLIRVLDRLTRAAVPFGLTLSVSPTLICMLRDDALLRRFRNRLERTIALAGRDADRASGPHRANAIWHARFFSTVARLFDQRCNGDVIGALREFSDSGVLELATTAATHAFLPAHQSNPAIARAQIGVGLDAFESAFGRRPRFFWLPECGYYPGLEESLAPFGIEAFAVESHAVLQATPPAPDSRTPVRCPNGVVAIARDTGLSERVWNARIGYPGDPNYREFHRDRIHELPDDEVGKWLDGSVERLPSGLKYWRVTGGDQPKDWYSPLAAKARSRVHARDFATQLAGVAPGTVCFLPFDAELFGHWWFEGPEWLEDVFRLIAGQTGIEASTVSNALARCAVVHEATPAASTWGHRGDNSFWVNHDTAWLFPLLGAAESRLRAQVSRLGDRAKESLEGRMLRQAARTLLLAHASDWPFMISAGSTADIARARLREYLEALDNQLTALEAGTIDPAELAAFEARDTAFPEIDLAHFAEPASLKAIDDR